MKIVGIVLLVLLAVVLFLLLMLLFVPFTYRVAGSFHEKQLRLRGNVVGFAGLLGAGIEAREGKWDRFLRVFGIKIHPGRQKQKPAKKHRGRKKTKRAEPEEPVSYPSEPWEPEMEPEAATVKKPGLLQKIRAFFEKIRTGWQRLCAAVRSFRETAGRFLAMVNDEENRQGVRVLAGWFFRLLRYLSPRKMKFSLAFSTGSPDTTGQLLGVLALFPPAYRNRFCITPDFEAEEWYAESDFDVRGHIYGIQILYVAVGILLDKDCQKLYNKII